MKNQPEITLYRVHKPSPLTPSGWVSVATGDARAIAGYIAEHLPAPEFVADRDFRVFARPPFKKGFSRVPRERLSVLGIL